MSGTIRIATRKSPLALRQTELAIEWLTKSLPERRYQSLPLSTKVDERLNWSLEKRGGIGLFTKELETALLEGQADLAVHSAKDMPTASPKGLTTAGYLPRARVNDILVLRSNCPEPATIATGSPRRRAQIGKLYPNAEWAPIRGNVNTRLEKIAAGDADATLLAAAGLDRLNIKHHAGLDFRELSIEQLVPAPGQAAIAVQCRIDDLPIYRNCFCPLTELAVSIEKAFLSRLGSGCQTPVGAYFADRVLQIYHPETGYRCFPMDLKQPEEIETALDGILNTLKL